MHHPVREVHEGELAARGAQIALVVVVRFVVAIRASDHGIGANVKLAPINKQRVVYILLHDAGLPRRAGHLTDDVLQLVPFLGDLDTVAAVRALTRFTDPDITLMAVLIVVLFEGVEVRVTQALLDMERDR